MNQMGWSKKTPYIFDLKFARLLGIYQILDPSTAKHHGHNLYHIIIYCLLLFMFTILLLSPFGLYSRMNDSLAFTYYSGCISNSAFSSYKFINVIYFSKDIWKCIDIADQNFLKYQHYNKNIFKKWEGRSKRITFIYLIIFAVPSVIWIISPILITTPVVNIQNLDGSTSTYRLNCFNLYLIASDETYNRYFYFFYFIEFVAFFTFVYFSLTFDILVLWMCYAFSSQLETISYEIESLGYEKSKNNSTENRYVFVIYYYFLMIIKYFNN